MSCTFANTSHVLEMGHSLVAKVWYTRHRLLGQRTKKVEQARWKWCQSHYHCNDVICSAHVNMKSSDDMVNNLLSSKKTQELNSHADVFLHVSLASRAAQKATYTAQNACLLAAKSRPACRLIAMHVAHNPCIGLGFHFARPLRDLQCPQRPALNTAADAEHACYAATTLHKVLHMVFLMDAYHNSVVCMAIISVQAFEAVR